MYMYIANWYSSLRNTRGSRSLQNLVAISQRYCRPLLIIKPGCIGSSGKNRLLNPESSSQSEGYSSKWLIWLVCREPLNTYLFVELVCESICHHCLPSPGGSMKQHHHTSTIGDSIIQTHPLTALLVGIKVADRVQDKLLLLLAKNHLWALIFNNRLNKHEVSGTSRMYCFIFYLAYINYVS